MKKPVKMGLWCLVILCLLVTVATHFLGPRVARVTTEKLIQEMTGFETELGEMDLDLWHRTIELKDVRLKNPEGFDGGEAVWIRRLYAEPTWDAITGKSATFRKVELDIAELFVVQPKAGPSNMEQLADNAETWQSARITSAAPTPRAAEPVVTTSSEVKGGEDEPVASTAAAKDMATQIDELTVRLGVVNVIDHEHGGSKPLTFRHEINREKTLVDVTDLDAVSEELLMEFAVNSLFDQIAEPLNDLMPGLANELQGFLKQLSEPSAEGASEGEDDPLDQFKDVLEGLL